MDHPKSTSYSSPEDLYSYKSPTTLTILETERLILEEAAEADAAFFHELMNSPSWIKYIGDRNIHNLDQARKYINDSLINSYHINGFGLYKVVLKSKGTPIGICGLLKRETLANPDIGFALLPSFENQGYAFEASVGVLKYAKEKLGLRTVLAITMKENLKSNQLLKKLGLQVKDTYKPNDNAENLLLYSIDIN